MAEAIISRRGKANGSSGRGELITQTFSANTSFNVPAAINNSFYVTIFGGGGGSNGINSAGGGGGWMNNGELELTAGSVVPITIGKGGNFNSQSGGTSSFGAYLSANGGSGQTTIYNVTSRRTFIACTGGNGGAGGGAYICSFSFENNYKGGTGFQFGGGGPYGNGGAYGGGGGGIAVSGNENVRFNDGTTDTSASYSGLSYGIGGTYGGNGGGRLNFRNNSETLNTSGRNGTNTINDSNIVENLQGPGFGGIGSRLYSHRSNNSYAGGGGGGYGGNGGTTTNNFIYTRDNCYDGIALRPGGYYSAYNGYQIFYICGSGGGGGYKADGGSGNGYASGGGGGYGQYGHGGNGIHLKGGGGGGSYGKGADNSSAGFGGGGCGDIVGGDGICIIQYYA